MSGQITRSVRHRRRRKFIRPDMQLPMVFIMFAVTCVTLVIQMWVVLASLDEVSNNLNEDLTVFGVLSFLHSSIVRGLFLSLTIALPLAVGCGMLYSFRFAGPVHRFQQYFSQLCGGRWDTRCSPRKNDQLQDVAESIDGAIDDARDRMFEDQSIMQDVKHLLTNTVFATDDASRGLVVRLQARIDFAEKEFDRRFPDADMSPSQFVVAPVAQGGDASEGIQERDDRPEVGRVG